MMGVLLTIKMLIYLKKVNTSKVRDVELLSVQGNNSGDTLIAVTILEALMILTPYIEENS